MNDIANSPPRAPRPTRGKRRGWRLVVIICLSLLGLFSGFVVAVLASGTGRPTERPTPSPSQTVAGSVTVTDAVSAPSKRTLPLGLTFVRVNADGSVSKADHGSQFQNMSVAVTDSVCNVTKIDKVNQVRHGTYCVVSVSYSARGVIPLTLTAPNQMIYGIPARIGASDGYRGTIFIDEANAPVNAIVIVPGKQRNVRLAVNIQDGFSINQLLPQEN